jgi:hypothetical protein
MYRIGYPAWKTLAHWGVPIIARINVHHDAESNSPDLDGLAVSGNTLDEIRGEATQAASTLINLALNDRKTRAHTELRLRGEALRFA